MEEEIIAQEEQSLPEIWRDTEAPLIAGHYIYGSKGLTKMLQFAKKTNLSNKEVEEVMRTNPSIEEIGGDKDYVKLFQKFQRALLKYRGYVYHFPNRVSIKNKKQKTNESSDSNKHKNRKARREHLQPANRS